MKTFRSTLLKPGVSFRRRILRIPAFLRVVEEQTNFRKSFLSLAAKKKKGIGQLDRDRRDDRPKRNARDDKTQFELKTALL